MEDAIKDLFEIKTGQLPTSVPIFPLENVLLLPFAIAFKHIRRTIS